MYVWMSVCTSMTPITHSCSLVRVIWYRSPISLEGCNFGVFNNFHLGKNHWAHVTLKLPTVSRM